MLFSRKKKKAGGEVDFSEIKLFEDEKKEKDVGFYEGTRASDEFRRQRRSETSENSGYAGLFDEGDLDFDDKPKKSVAKTYGTKYISDGKQIASSIVVDVRSYKKEEKSEPDVSVHEEVGQEKPKRSFFDDLLKELEENEKNEKEEEEEELLPPPIVEPKKAPVKKDKKAPAKKRKKSIDIDIISGDFGGTDII